MAASVVIEMSAKEARLVRALQKVVAEEAKVQAGFKKAGESARAAGMNAQNAGAKMQRAGQQGSRAFGAAALSQLRNFAAGFVTVSSGVMAVTRALYEMKEAREAAAASQEQAFYGIGSLAQLAKTPEEMQSLIAATEKTYKEGVGESMDEAARLVFQLQSAGAMKARKLFAELQAKGVVADAETFIKATATLMTSMGERETGGYRAIVSKAFGASGQSPSKAGPILEAAAKAGVPAGQIGLSDEELLAATALVSKATGGADIAGTYMAQLFRTLRQKGDRFKGKSLEQIILEIQREQLTPKEKEEFFKITPEMEEETKKWFLEFMGRPMTEEERKQWFGRAQGRQAFDIIASNLGSYRYNLAQVREAQRTDEVQAHLDVAMQDPRQRAVLAKRQAAAAEEVSATKLGIEKNLADTVLDEYAAAVRSGKIKTPWPEIEIAGTRLFSGIGRFFTGDESWLRRSKNAGALRRAISEDTSRQIAEVTGEERWLPDAQPPARLRRSLQPTQRTWEDWADWWNVLPADFAPLPAIPFAPGHAGEQGASTPASHARATIRRATPEEEAESVQTLRNTPAWTPDGQPIAPPPFLPLQQEALEAFRKATGSFAEGAEKINRAGDRMNTSRAGLGSPLKDQ